MTHDAGNNKGLSRRDLLRVIGVTAGMASLASLPGYGKGDVFAHKISNSEEDRPMSAMKPIVVNHEWGTLKEVIVGNPFFYFPKTFPDWMKDWVFDTAKDRYEKMLGGTMEAKLPDIYHEQVTQIQRAIEILQSRGIIVHQVKVPTADELRYLENEGDFLRLTTYPRDEVLVIGNHFIETSIQYPGRRSTRWAIRRTVSERLEKSNARIVSMPEPPPGAADQDSFVPGAYLESGDVFPLGRDILVGRSGNGSNSAGIQWLQRYLGEEYRVHEIPLSKHFLHLDGALCTVRPGLAMICKEAFAEGIPSVLKDWEFIDVAADEAERKQGCNHLVVDGKTIMVPSELPHLVEALTKAGQEVIAIPFGALIWQGGSFRCWHHPLVRESSL